MPEGVGYGPQYTASVGKSLNYIGQHVYGYSGEITVDNNETNLLDFTSGKEYLVCKVQFSAAHSSGDDYVFRIRFNGIVVQRYITISAFSESDPNQPLYMIIPPLTSVQCSAQNVSDTSSNNQIVAITGKIYK